MREIKFRGKRLDNGEWQVGSLLFDEGNKLAYIGYVWEDGERLYQVDPETVGQYTGLKDKEGSMIWEGDIIETQRVYANGEVDTIKYTRKIEFEEGCFCGRIIQYELRNTTTELHKFTPKIIKVIGTIYDNPELLKA